MGHSRSFASSFLLLAVLVTGCVAIVRFKGQEGSFAVLGRGGAPSRVATAGSATAPRVQQQKLDSSLVDLIRQLPKAELHIHIEGTLEAVMMMRFAERNNITLPYKNLAEAEAARWVARCSMIHNPIVVCVSRYAYELASLWGKQYA